MTHTIHVVDAFTDEPLAGNQLAVVLDAQDIPSAVVRRIANEMNFAESRAESRARLRTGREDGQAERDPHRAHV